MIEFDVDMGYLLECDELDKVVLNDENGEHEPIEFVPKDAATVGDGEGSRDEWRSVALGLFDSLEKADLEEAKRWIRDNDLLRQEIAYGNAKAATVGEQVTGDTSDDNVTHYLPEMTCMNEWKEFGKFLCSECGLQVDSMSTNSTFPEPIVHCPRCGARVVRT